MTTADIINGLKDIAANHPRYADICQAGAEGLEAWIARESDSSMRPYKNGYDTGWSEGYTNALEGMDRGLVWAVAGRNKAEAQLKLVTTERDEFFKAIEMKDAVINELEGKLAAYTAEPHRLRTAAEKVLEMRDRYNEGISDAYKCFVGVGCARRWEDLQSALRGEVQQ